MESFEKRMDVSASESTRDKHSALEIRSACQCRASNTARAWQLAGDKRHYRHRHQRSPMPGPGTPDVSTGHRRANAQDVFGKATRWYPAPPP
eukprot:849133-Rhodomonas_salina.2